MDKVETASVKKDSAANPSPSKKPGSLLARLKSVKHIELIAAGIAVAVMLVIYFGAKPFSGGGTQSEPSTVRAKEDYCQKIERELTETLSKMDGAGDTRVIVHWESSVEAVIAYITNISQNGTSSSPQVISGGGTQSPIVLKEIYPKAVGVVIMCRGASNVKVKLDIITAVSVLLDIKPDRIQVLTMKK